MSTELGAPLPHESAHLHVTGRARYIDDLAAPAGMLHAMVLPSPHARARILRRDGSRARALPGVHGVFFADDIPGTNNVGPIVPDEPLLAEDEVHCVGQAVAIVCAESRRRCREALRAIEVEYEPLPALVDLEEAIERGSFIGTPHRIRRGDFEAAFSGAPVRLEGTFRSPPQDHFYLETHVAQATPEEDRTLSILSSTQAPTAAQNSAAGLLGWPRSRVVVECPRMGGAFGGKESQGTQWACVAALGAALTGRPVRVRLDRDQDMTLTGKRHPFFTRWAACADHEGRLLGLRAHLYADAGWASDLSSSILDRGLYHVDNAYYLPVVDLAGYVVRTNRMSNTAFRGFGGPQGMLVVEHVMERIAHAVGLDPLEVRRRNFYGDAPRDRTPYGQQVRAFRLPYMVEKLAAEADLEGRREQVRAFNAARPHHRRALALTPVKFGISFTSAKLNQAGAYLCAYGDGSVQLNHGGTEMGQGLYTKMIQVCAHTLGVGTDRIRHMATRTDKVPNTAPTAASTGSDLNGQAVYRAARTLVERLRPVAAGLLFPEADNPDPTALCLAAHAQDRAEGPGGEPARLPEDGHPPWAWIPGGNAVSFPQVCQQGFLDRVHMAAAGYYATPGIAYDRDAGRGTPFHYFAYGAALTEVELSGLTGEWRVRQVDILHDVGDSLSRDVDLGQVEGAFVQGLGWLTCEEIVEDADASVITHSPSTYKIPAMGDVPVSFRVDLLERAAQPGVIYGSKAVGEPPFMLAISAWLALERAASAFAEPGSDPGAGGDSPRVWVSLPCTPEHLLDAVERARRGG